MRRHRKSESAVLAGTMALFIFSGFLLLTLKDLTARSVVMMFAVPAAFLLSTTLIPKIVPADTLLLALVNFLSAFGVMVLYRISPDKGVNQAINYAAGAVAMLLCMMVVRKADVFKPLTPVMALAALGLMVLPALIGRERGGAKAWIQFAGVLFQPSEVVKVALLIVNAYLLSKRKLMYSVLYTGLCIGLLILQKDMGTALLYYTVSLVMMYAATGSLPFLLSGVAGAAGAAYGGYAILKRIGFAHIERRITAWVNPWGTYKNEGFQTVQSLLAIVNGGLLGMGFGAGNASNIPVRESDSIFPFIVNEFGMVAGLCLIAVYLIIFVRGVGIGLRANTRFRALLALGCSVFIAFQTFVIIGGNINLIPITGVTLPFISYGGTSLVSGMCIIGVLQGIESVNEDDMAQDAALAAPEVKAK